MRDWAHTCDGIVCSTDVQALKAEAPERFFRPYLEQYGLGFSDAALIDDQQDNCEAFQAAGGTPLRYKMDADDIESIQMTMANWLQRSNPPHRLGHGRTTPTISGRFLVREMIEFPVLDPVKPGNPFRSREIQDLSGFRGGANLHTPVGPASHFDPSPFSWRAGGPEPAVGAIGR